MKYQIHEHNRPSSTRAAGILAAAGICAAIAASPTQAQIFQRAVGAANDEVAYAIEETRDCGYITVGEIGPSPAGLPGSAHIMKHRYDGAVTWSVAIPSNGRSVAYTVDGAASTAGGYIVAGESNVFPGLGIMLTRIDALGNGIWSRVYTGTPFLDFPAGVSVRQFADGTIVACGRWQGVAGGPVMGVLMRVDPAGNPIFQRVYTLAGAQVPVSFTDLREIPGGILVSGTILDPASGLEQALVMQTDAAGNPLVVRSYAGPGRLFGDGMDTDAGGNIVMSGRFAQPGTPLANTVVWRLDAAFNPIWSSEILRSVNGFQAVRWTNEPSVIVAGTQPATIGPSIADLVRFSPAGATTLSRFYGGNGPTEGHGAIHPLRRLTFSLTGRTSVPPTNGGASDTYMVVANPNGDTPCLMAPGPQVIPIGITVFPRQIAGTFQQGQQNFSMPVPYTVGNLPYCTIGCPADFDGNGVVNPADIAAFVSNWNASLMAGNYGGDFNCDGAVAPADIASFVSTWNTALMTGCP